MTTPPLLPAKRCPHLKLMDMVLRMAKGLLRCEYIWRWRDYLVLSEWAHGNHKVLVRVRQECQRHRKMM